MSRPKRKTHRPAHSEEKPKGTATESRWIVLSPAHLIRFDCKTWIFLGVCAGMFFLFTILKWHNSSIGCWNLFAGDGTDTSKGLILGAPRPIRSDEWQVYSSFILSQHARDFPVSNPSLGEGNIPLTFNLPTQSILSKVKPAFWGYYFLDIERAYAWHWNFKLWSFLAVAFLTLMLLTRNHFMISVTGSIWLLLSSAVQWWSINTEIFTYGLLSLTAFIYILYGTRRRHIIGGSIAFVLAAYSYAMILYPAYQILFAYFLMAILTGYIVAHKKMFQQLSSNLHLWKAGSIIASLACLSGLMFYFYSETKDVIAIMSDTYYPGKVRSSGGTLPFARFFTDNFSWFLSENKHPIHWNNICELSSYLMLSVAPMFIIIADYVRRRKTDAILMASAIFQVVLFVFIFVGVPAFISNLTFLNSSQSIRAFFIFGFTNVILTLLYLARHEHSILKNNPTSKILSFVVMAGIATGMHLLLQRDSYQYFSASQIIIATLLYTVLSWLVIQFSFGKIFRIAFYIILLGALVPNLRINPLAEGLAPYFENEIFNTIKQIYQKDPNADWAVFGKTITPNLVKATGAKCLNGVNFVPPLEKLHYIDSGMKHDSIYNRFAHIGLTTLIDGKDSIQFDLKQSDLYMLRMDPCSPKLTQLGVKYIVFTYQPQDIEIACMTGLAGLVGHVIYQLN